MTTPADPAFEDLLVLLVEDDEIMRFSLEDRLRLEGIPVRSAADLAGAVRILEKGQVDLLVSDMRLPDGSGQMLFERVGQNYPGTPVILMTAYESVPEAVALVKAGAIDYLTKPFALDGFIERVRLCLSRVADTRLAAELTGDDGTRFRAGSGILGKSPQMRRIERLVARLADVDSPVLITGESGVGKEVVAGLIHHNSRRAEGPLVRVNCAAIPLTMVESELFGHERGSFTGADRRHVGRFEQAQGGTIFLDEIAEIPPETQVKLLRVLQEYRIERLGGSGSVALDVRVIAATQVDPETAVDSGAFRSDLYWRLNVIRIHIPPLRERPEDILYLSRMFVGRHAAEIGKEVSRLSPEAESRLMRMTFPGNVRELGNLLERAVILCNGPRIMEHDLLPTDAAPRKAEDHEQAPSLKAAVEVAERAAIRDALARNQGAVTKTARDLGISRKSLWEKLKRYGIEKEI